jgi:hypothetical protein
MAEIFLSYSSEDRARVAPLAKALAGAGFSVWWDRDIRPGSDFSETIEREIKAAEAVVVAWTEHSARSEWVRDEAAFARNEGKLIPLRFSETEPPMGFRQTQAIDFRNWRNDLRSPAFLSLHAALQGLLLGETGTASARAGSLIVAPEQQALPGRRALWLALSVSLAIAAGVSVWLFSPAATETSSVVMGAVEITPFTARPDDPERNARAASYTDAFRQRLTELDIANRSPSTDGAGPRPELVLIGELAGAGTDETLTARLDDFASGTTLWSVRRKPSEDAAAEADLAGFAMRCALSRRNAEGGTQQFAHFLRGCAQFFEGDFAGWVTTAKSAYALAPHDPNVLAFLAVANAGHGWGDSNSVAEHRRLMADAKRYAEEALRQDSGNPDALFAMGFTFDDFHFKDQENWWRRAVETDLPGWATGRYANLLFTVGRTRESLDMEIRALQNRRTLYGGTRAARRVAAQGEEFEAQRLYNLVRKLDRIQVDKHELITFILYGSLESARNLLAERQERLELSAAQVHCLGRVVAARQGESVAAEELADGCRLVTTYSLYALAGQLDAAFTEVESVLEDSLAVGRFPPQLFMPEFREFLRDPRFWPLAAKMGLVDYWLDTDQWPDFCLEPDLPFDCRQQAAEARVAQGDRARSPE